MATSTPVSIPIPSSRPALSWKDRVQRFLLLDSTLGYLFLLPALLVIVGLVAYPFASAIVMTFQEKPPAPRVASSGWTITGSC